MDRIIKTLLANRGIKTKKQREEFFNPTDPGKLSPQDVGINKVQLNKAVKRIRSAIKNKEKIIVYGDYDVDGVCATAILWETLHFLGARALPYIPDRFTEGYGLNEERIKKLKEEDPELGLIITVDHGIIAHEKVDLAKELGVDVIITDHHESGKTRPKAHAVVHTTKVSGSTVAWILARAIAAQIRNLDHLGLAALGTVADVLPLVGYNRSIVVYGLEVLRRTRRPGIRALCREAGTRQEEIKTFHIGFILGPRLNAMGRVEHAIDSLRLLCTRSRSRAQELALKLGRTNKMRQDKTETIFNHVNENFGAFWSNGNLPKLLFVYHEDYDEGVIGIVAGRLVEKYHRPAIVVARGKELSKASARSVKGVDIIETIRKVGEEFFVNVGGHKMAAGFTVRTEQLEALADKLTSLSERTIDDKALLKETRVDCEIELSLVSQELYQELAKFSPFGYGNPEPTFLTRNVHVEDARLVGSDKSHLKMNLKQNRVNIEAIGFRMSDWYTKLSPNKKIDIVYSIEEDNWNGSNRLQLKIRDIWKN